MSLEQLRKWQYENGFGMSEQQLVASSIRLGMLTKDLELTDLFDKLFEQHFKESLKTVLENSMFIEQSFKRALSFRCTRTVLAVNSSILLVRVLKGHEETILLQIEPTGLRLAHLYFCLGLRLVDLAFEQGVIKKTAGDFCELVQKRLVNTKGGYADVRE